MIACGAFTLNKSRLYTSSNVGKKYSEDRSVEHREIERLLSPHQIDTASLSLILSRGEERLYALMVPETDAIAQWRRLRDVLSEHGYWPVVGFDSRWLDESTSYGLARHMAGSTRDILIESEAVDPEQWMAAQEQGWLETLRGGAAESGEPEPADVYEGIWGAWPEHPEPYRSYAIPHYAATHDPTAQVPIALVPATACWQVPAVLRLDSEYASSAVHVAMARRWYDHYGAEIVGMLPDTLEMQVEHPPTTCEDAGSLAKEQFLYCPDVVIQGTQTLLALAAGLLHGSAWYFWWD